MPKQRLILLVLVMALVGATSWWFLKQRQDNDGRSLRLSGNIEVTETTIGFEVLGRVESRLVDEGDIVRKGDLIATVDTSLLTNFYGIARARAREAAAGLAELEGGSRPQEIALTAATVASAKAEAERRQLDFQRAEELLRDKTISQQDYDATRAAHDVAVAQLQEAEERLKLVREGPRQEQIEQGRARVEQGRSMLALAETLLGNARLASPVSGIVLSKSIDPGEFVFPGTPVITLGNLERVWLRAYVSETDLGRVKLGQQARVTTDTYPDKTYEGQLSFISSEAEFTPKSVQTRKERVKLVYRVKIDIANPDLELKPGMPADAEILLGPEGRDGGDPD